MTPQEFIAKWQRADLSERSACQQHFLDLCDVLGQPKPAEADPDGAWYTFERGVSKTTGKRGWADVWMRKHFGWEYKGKHKNLDVAYQQLLLYREDLENPPLLVVCDLDRFHIHTNFTGTAKRVYKFDLEGFAEPDNFDVLRKLFTDPESLRPGLTTDSITRQAAERFGLLADGMRVRGVEAPAAAHFLMKLMFCMFGEDIALLPEKIFTRVLAGSKNAPKQLAGRLRALFQAMADGGYFGADEIMHFNGGLFTDADVVELRGEEIEELIRVNDYDWADVEPSIFGTLFERTLDPAKRSQIGAHYTSRKDILTLLEPVVMTPLRREWAEVQAKCERLWEKVQAEAPKRSAKARKPSKAARDHERLLLDFVERLAHVKILDPACGSGNFLYVAINLLLDLEKKVISYAAGHGVSILPHVRPTQLAGIEINPYAQQLAQVVIWIGYLQWMHNNGFKAPTDPVLGPIESIHLMDAIIDLSDPENPKEPDWPEADFIVGNPPFLGGSRIWEELGREYQQQLWSLYEGRLPGFSDLCCYWFEKARQQIADEKGRRAGLLATQGIRGGANREVLKRTKETGDIFFAVSDRNWILDGANVHISIVGFDNGNEELRELDGQRVSTINSNLTSTADVTKAQRLAANGDIAFIGTKKAGPFNIPEQEALEWLQMPNPHGKPNSDVLRLWANGSTLVKRTDTQWIIDSGVSSSYEAFALYEKPFSHSLEFVKPQRDKNKRRVRRERWWLHAETCPAMRISLLPLSRYLATPRVSKHRAFVWLHPAVLSDDGVFVFARSDDYFLGVLHSRIHEVWALRLGTRLETRPRYTPTTCFETFPFPEPTDDQKAAIAEAAKELDALRNNWLNPPEWTCQEVLEFPGSVDGPWARYVDEPDDRGIGTVRYPRIVPRDEECAKQLKKRTLTNLYNQRPTWLDLAHRRLDEAVFAAYGWNPGMSDEELLAAVLALNLERAAEESVAS